MDPLDHLFAPPDGLRCSVCDERVPTTRIRLLARRDDLAFMEIDCEACGSATLGFVLDGRSDEPAEPLPGTPVTADDVLDRHQLLAGWRGDLAGLLARDRPSGADPDHARGRAGSSR
jgi:hypothetical protein